jgi:hypothetical protein
MSDTWYLLVIAVAAVAIYFMLRSRRTADHARRDALLESDAGPRDYDQERETNRMSHMSESDKAWQEASLQRHRDNQARDQTPPATP